MKRMAVMAALALALVGSARGQQAQEQTRRAEETHKNGEDLFREFLENEARELSLDDTKNLTIFELVDVIMKVQLTEVLGLTKDEAKVLFEKMGNYLDKIHKLKWERGALHYYLKEDLRLGADDEDIARKLNAAMDVEVKIAELNRAMINETGPCLSTEQQGKLFFFTFDFENDIKRMIQQAEDLAAQRHGPTGGEFKLIDPQITPDEKEKRDER